jgi:Sin3 binding region of histone deacetylase complex subunit SAP30
MIGRQRTSSAPNGSITGAGVERRVPKEQLAMAVRKDFNAAAVNEAEVVTNFLYVVKNQGESLWTFTRSVR